MSLLLWGVVTFLLLNAFACLWRAIVGPTLVDRILAINVIGTKTLVALVIIAFVAGRGLLLDVALVYGLLNFGVTIAAARFLETGRFERETAP
jgi:multicomponent Na+:H+ antiporter subunit F